MSYRNRNIDNRRWPYTIEDNIREELKRDLIDYYGSLNMISPDEVEGLFAYSKELIEDPCTYLFGCALDTLARYIEEDVEYQGTEEDEGSDEDYDEDDDSRD